jgi:glycosyltransferase involved in cell wall biosynthesis
MRAGKKIAALRGYFADRPRLPAPLLCGYQEAMHGTLAGLRGFHCLMHDTPDLFAAPGETSLKARARRWVSNRTIGRGLRSGGRTIVTSEHLRAECRKDFGVEADIARMGGLEAGEAFRLRPVEGTLRMLSVSRLEANKRIDWMLRALAAMEREGLSQRADWALDVTGRGAQADALQAMAAELGIAERIHFLGFVDDATLQRTYAAAHLFLMPAVQGYGIPAIEALGRGLPVLLHRESGVSDILLETPWATVIEGGEEGMLPGLKKAVEGVIAGEQFAAPVPKLPTEDEWAKRVAVLCGWVKA